MIRTYILTPPRWIRGEESKKRYKLNRCQWLILSLFCEYRRNVTISYDEIIRRLDMRPPHTRKPSKGSVNTRIKEIRILVGDYDIFENVHGVGYRCPYNLSLEI